MSTRKDKGFVPRERAGVVNPAPKNRAVAAKYGRLAAESARSGTQLAARDFARYAISIELGHAPEDLLRERVRKLRRHVRQAGKAIRDEDARVAAESEQIEKRILDRANEKDDHEAEKPIGETRAARVGKRGPDRDLKRMEFLARLGFAHELLVALLREAARQPHRSRLESESTLKMTARQELYAAGRRAGIRARRPIELDESVMRVVRWALDKRDDFLDSQNSSNRYAAAPRWLPRRLALERLNRLRWVKEGMALERESASAKVRRRLRSAAVVTLRTIDLARKELRHRHELVRYAKRHPQ